jgi:hypothetical protein
MDQPLNPITQSVFNDILEAQTRLRDDAERRWMNARKLVLEIAGYVASEWLHEKQKAGTDLERIPLEDLTLVIREQVTRLVVESSAAINTLPDPDLRQKYQRLDENFHRAEHRIRQLEAENVKMTTALKHLTSQEPPDRKPIGAISWEALPDFFLEWTQEKFFERQAALLRLIGDTGLARHPELERRLADITGLAVGGASLADTFKDLRQRNFIQSYTMESSPRGQPPGVDELTDLGQAAYLFLTGKKPLPSEMKDGISDHKTPAHLLLILKSKDWLKKAGYEISDQDARFYLSDNRQFNPDIIATKDGKTIYIEVERDSTKGNQDRDAKWNNFYDYTSGDLYVFCQNKKAQNNIIHEINAALQGFKLERTTTHFCNLEAINDDFIQANGHVWTTIRQRTKQSVSNERS